MPLVATQENLVDVFKFEVYSGSNDMMNKSRRYGTREAIEEIAKGHALIATKRSIDRSIVEAPNTDIPGLTRIDFNPDAQVGFQNKVVR